MRRLLQIVAAAILLTLFGGVVLLVVYPAATDQKVITVLTPSMSPAIEAGDAVIVRPTQEVGDRDIVTYYTRPGQPETITHRIVGTDMSANGNRWITRGDANEDSDRDPVRPEQILGVVTHVIPKAGYLAHEIRDKPLLIIGGASILAGAAVLALSGNPRRTPPVAARAATDQPRSLSWV